jgi:hypothetical protein
MAVCGQPTRLHADDPALRQHGGLLQKLRVFAGVDVVGDGGDGVSSSKTAAQLGHERRLAGADRAADA